MKGIFKRFSAGLTGKAGEKAREQREQKKASTRKRYLLRGQGRTGSDRRRTGWRPWFETLDLSRR
jgi:hypothetical protein